MTTPSATIPAPDATVSEASDSPDKYYLRNPDTVVTGDNSVVVVIRKNNQPVAIRNNVQLVLLLAQLLREPKQLTDLAAGTGMSIADLAPVVECLTREDIVSHGSREQMDQILTPPEESRAESVSRRHLVVGLSGAPRFDQRPVEYVAGVGKRR